MFYIILNPGTRIAELLTEYNGFTEMFGDYDEAVIEAEAWLKEEGHNRSYLIVKEYSKK